MLEYFIGTIIIFFLFLWYMGLFYKVDINDDKFKGGIYVYKNFQSHLNDLTKIRKEMYKDIRPSINTE
jgi:hypothetical protein